MKTTSPYRQNVLGPGIRELRLRCGWSQAQLSRQIEQSGQPCTRGRVAKMEARIVCITDEDILYLCKALRARTQDLYFLASLEELPKR